MNRLLAEIEHFLVLTTNMGYCEVRRLTVAEALVQLESVVASAGAEAEAQR